VSRLAVPLARRIDRLAGRAHRFHRWAHHPLCAAYAGEVIRLGRRTRLCRGCALFTAGALTGLAIGPFLGLPPAALLGGVALLAVAAVTAVAPRRAPGPGPGPGPAGGKLRSRFAPALLAGVLVSAGATAAGGPGLLAAALTLLVVALARWRYGRRGPDRSACAGCPAGPPGPGCPGFRDAAKRERAFRRLAARWIDRARPASCDAERP
jgi:MFS family permease